MAGYGWEEYDGRTGGKQVIRDKVNQLDIETYLVKVPGGEHGKMPEKQILENHTELISINRW